MTVPRRGLDRALQSDNYTVKFRFVGLCVAESSKQGFVISFFHFLPFLPDAVDRADAGMII